MKILRSFLWLSLLFSYGSTALADVPTNLEPDYSEAVLAYNAKNYDRALVMLNELLNKTPNISEFLELKALALKATNDTKETLNTYLLLIETKTKEGKSEEEIAPYHFELGVFRYKEKNFTAAHKHFTFALKNEFNEGVSNLYLGMMEFNKGDWSKAEEHFDGVISSSADDLKPVAYFYLGQAHMKMGYPSGATHNLVMARSSSKALINDKDTSSAVKKTSEKIYGATEKALAPFDHSQFFGNLGFLSGFDSNVLSLPSSITTPTETSKTRSFKQTLLFGVGYTTSPLGQFQLVPSYKGSFDYLVNDKIRNSEFHNHVLSLYITRYPLARATYGIKLEGTLILKNNVITPAGMTSFKLEQYGKTASLGPYFRYEVVRKLIFNLETFFQPQSFVKDGTGTLQRSGNDYLVRLSAQNDSGKRYFNPSLAVRYDKNDSKGNEFKSDTFGLDISNTLHFLSNLDLTVAINSARISYSKRPAGKRTDTQIAGKIMGTYKLTKKWSVLGNVDYAKNGSNFDNLYSYNRSTLIAGISYTF